MEAEAHYRLRDEQSNVKSEGQAKVILDEKYLTLMVEFGEPMLFSYTDIIGISDQDYRIDLFLSSKETLNLSGLGYQYEDFLSQLFRLRNELLLRYLLMEEALVKGGFGAQFSWFNPKGQMSQTGTCEVRLYDTALVVLPQKGEPIRLPYCFLSQINKGDYTLVLVNEFGEKFEFSMLGEKFDALAKDLSNALNRFILRSQATVKEMIPAADPVTVNKLAVLMKDGRAAKRKEIETLSPELWRRLSKKIENVGLGKEYGFLDAIALKEQVRIGVKRELMGDLTGSYLWLLVPLRRTNSGKLDNAVALEAFSTNESKAKKAETEHENTEFEGSNTEQSMEETESTTGGKATYFFRIMGRRDYAQTTEEELRVKLEDFLRDINRCMVDINFRREPIFLPEEKLDSPKYAQYRFAVTKLPSLRILRNQLIGRVVHSSFDQWKRDVTGLLDFNAKSKDNSAKWKKGAE